MSYRILPRCCGSATSPRRRGLSLMELLVVMVILIATAGLVTYLYSGALEMTVGKDGSGAPISKSVQQIGTEATLTQMRNAIVGTPGHPGYWNDVLSSQADTTTTPITLADLFRVPTATPSPPYSASTAPLATNLQTFNPNTGRGWRGPYMAQATGSYPNTTTGNWSARNFTATYGAANDPALIDAWGNPIVIQWPANSADSTPTATQQYQYVRLVSAGPNGVLDTPITDTPVTDPTGASLKDDVILYLRYVP